jgi:hypothetical protein
MKGFRIKVWGSRFRVLGLLLYLLRLGAWDVVNRG